MTKDPHIDFSKNIHLKGVDQPIVVDIAKLYYDYKRTEKADICSRLDQTDFAISSNDSGKFYKLTKESIDKIKQAPRNNSINFDCEVEKEPYNMIGLEIYKILPFLVKSTSHFFLKADIGEICDSMGYWDMHHPPALLVTVNLTEHLTINGTQDEHFIMFANVYIEKDYHKKFNR